MTRGLLIASLSGALLVATALPNGSALLPGVSGSAHAATNLNSSRSNIYRTKKQDTPKPARRGPSAPSSGKSTY